MWMDPSRVSEKIAGWPEHYFGPRVRASHEGLLLIGEAWGIDALLGEGIAPCFAISEYAAKRLKSALDRIWRDAWASTSSSEC